MSTDASDGQQRHDSGANIIDELCGIEAGRRIKCNFSSNSEFGIRSNLQPDLLIDPMMNQRFVAFAMANPSRKWVENGNAI